MPTSSWTDHIAVFDERRNIAIPGDKEATLTFCVEQFVSLAKEAMEERDSFHVALSGGSTPKALFQLLSNTENRQRIEWSKIHLYWSDERSVAPTDPDSNYKMAMDAGLAGVGIPDEQIHRMVGEVDIPESAKEYDQLIRGVTLDMVMLGMGDDGHTASLFPETHALHSESGRLVVENYVPQKETWRMTFTYDAIHSARQRVFYVIGEGKAEMLNRVLNGNYTPDQLPSQRVGTPQSKALWIADEPAARLL